MKTFVLLTMSLLSSGVLSAQNSPNRISAWKSSYELTKSSVPKLRLGAPTIQDVPWKIAPTKPAAFFCKLEVVTERKLGMQFLIHAGDYFRDAGFYDR